jgi:UDP:flavonoid glycosyltransferase YjiC (YdhE family)
MTSKTIAYFVSPHGYGHAARACAVMEAMHARQPDLRFEIFTRAPFWFFEASLGFQFGYHLCTTDIGLIQSSPLVEDLPATLRALEEFIPFTPERLAPAVQSLHEQGCNLAICDISPLGIAAAHAAGLPAVLIENFTWDWIYGGFLAEEPGLSKIIPEFARVFNAADARIQTEPVTVYAQSADLITCPVARPPRKSKAAVRRALGIPVDAPAVMVTMGGFELDYSFLELLTDMPTVFFILPGGSAKIEVRGNLALLPNHSDFYHPDLIHASDAVISKAGYSTIAEAYYASIPFGYVSRDQFRESPVLSAFIQQHIGGFEIDGASFQSGEWVKAVPRLLKTSPIPRKAENGAAQVAEFIELKYLPA